MASMLKVIWSDIRSLGPDTWRGALYALLGIAGCALVALLGVAVVALIGSPAYLVTHYWLGWPSDDSKLAGMWSGIFLFAVSSYLLSVRERAKGR